MSDIISSIAWECGDRDCAQQWHKSNYWIQDDGDGPDGAAVYYTVDEFSDGDHETIDETDLPTPEQEVASWDRYARYVAETGEDPLNNFLVHTEDTVREEWEFLFGATKAGVVLEDARLDGEHVEPKDVPKGVREYLTMDGGPEDNHLHCFEGAEGIEDFQKAGLPIAAWRKETVEYSTPRDPETVREELKRVAAKNVREGEKA